MKKIIIIFSLILSLFINLVPVSAMEYATTYGHKFYIYYTNVTEDSKDIDVIFKDSSGNYLKISSTDYTVSGRIYYFVDGFVLNKDYSINIYCSGVLINTTTFKFNSTLSNPLEIILDIEEDNGGTESPGDSESPDDSGSGNDGSVTTLDVSLLHTDLLILIVIIGFFEFMKMINIIVRNYGGGK